MANSLARASPASSSTLPLKRETETSSAAMQAESWGVQRSLTVRVSVATRNLKLFRRLYKDTLEKIVLKNVQLKM